MKVHSETADTRDDERRKTKLLEDWAVGSQIGEVIDDAQQQRRKDLRRMDRPKVSDGGSYGIQE